MAALRKRIRPGNYKLTFEACALPAAKPLSGAATEGEWNPHEMEKVNALSRRAVGEGRQASLREEDNVQTPVPGDTAHPTALVTHPDRTPAHTVGVAAPASKPDHGVIQVISNDSPCLGISHDYVSRAKSKYKDEYAQGFYHLVGNAFRDKAHFISTDQCWPHGTSNVGCLRDTNGT